MIIEHYSTPSFRASGARPAPPAHRCLYILLLVATTVVACDRDDDGPPSDLGRWGPVAGCAPSLNGTYNGETLSGYAFYWNTSSRGSRPSEDSCRHFFLGNTDETGTVSRYSLNVAIQRELYHRLAPMTFRTFTRPDTSQSVCSRSWEGLAADELVLDLRRDTGGGDTEPWPRYEIVDWSENAFRFDSVFANGQNLDARGSFIAGSFTLRFRLSDTPRNQVQIALAREKRIYLPETVTFTDCTFQAFRFWEDVPNGIFFGSGECPM